MRQEGEGILDLTISNPTSALFETYPHAEIRKALSALTTFSYSPDPFGLPSAREAISHFYQRSGYVAPPSSIALTASTSEAYSLLFKLFCNPGDEVLVPVPSYPLFEFLARLEDVRTVPYRLYYDGIWSIDFEDLEANISPACRAVVIVNPNNPTGSFLKRWELAHLTRLALKHNLPVIADEVFMSYPFSPDGNRISTLIGQDEVLSFSLNGLSKTAGMPQLKLAWMVLNGPASAREQVTSRLEILLDTYLSVNTPVQLALPALLEAGSSLRTELLARINLNLKRTAALLAGSAVQALHVEGGWSLMLQLPRTRSEEEWLIELLRARNVLLQPGYFFDMPSEAFAVASLIVEPEEFAEGISRLRDLVAANE